MTRSFANFLFVRHARIGGEMLYKKLREKGVLVRHFGAERIKEYNRITVGSMDQMQTLVGIIKEILEETP
jgi:histidinol-phosphate aminotransferase